ncbi:hypothetical protein SAMN05421837_107390 [Amycolatopsis pretoriensis]|uniref:Uncharacterized protein n=1 Tax=Amycolatopsis pretoriensis TaxID=218821 RepID=A0A1H5RA20_9PSEU|nr:hypothetical protein SAMN05421837_107390 [Amycolatopsis pretoriensis]
MNLRRAALAVGFVGIFGGVLMVFVPLRAESAMGKAVHCGTAISPSAPGVGPATGAHECGQVVTDWQAAAGLIVGGGAVLCLGGMTIPAPRHREMAPAHPGDESGSAGA